MDKEAITNTIIFALGLTCLIASFLVPFIVPPVSEAELIVTYNLGLGGGLIGCGYALATRP